MSENNKALLSGIGPLNKVAEAWIGEFMEYKEASANVHDALVCVEWLLDKPETERAAFALACSVLNRHFCTRRWLHRISEDCHYDNEYVSSTFVHEAMMESYDL